MQPSEALKSSNLESKLLFQWSQAQTICIESQSIKNHLTLPKKSGFKKLLFPPGIYASRTIFAVAESPVDFIPGFFQCLICSSSIWKRPESVEPGVVHLKVRQDAVRKSVLFFK